MTQVTPEIQSTGRFHGMMDSLGLMARASLVGMGGLALAVEGGALIGHDIPGIVIEAVAGTGIPAANITSKCPPNSTAGVKVVVTEAGKSFTFSFKDLTDGHTGSQNIPFGESGGFNAPVGHQVLTSYSGGPETDTQTVECAVDTTVAPTTVAPTTVAPTTVAPTTVAPTTAPPTTVRQTTTVPPTTVAQPGTTSPGASIPRGESGNTATTNTTSGSVELSPQTPNTETTDVSSSTVPSTSAAGKAEAGSLARTGSDSEAPLGIAGSLVGMGALFVVFARRRRNAEQASQ